MKIQSYLPVFPGFYNTLLEYNREEDDLLQIEEYEGKEYDYEDIEWDYQDYEQRVAEACVGAIEHELKTSGLDITITFEKLVSPREYNFTNDSINVEYELSEETFAELRAYAREHYKEFEAYLKERYSSRSGFISFYDPDPVTWFREYLDPEHSKIKHTFGSLLDFYFQNEGFTEEDLYYAVDSETGYIDYKLPEED